MIKFIIMAKRSKQEEAELRHVFGKAGARFTRQREAVWQLFKGKARGLTIPEAAKALKRKGVGPATVYRTAALLEGLGLLRRVHDAGGERRFVASRPGHYHALVCRSCGQVVDFEGCDLSLLERVLTTETGFRIEGHHLEVFGLCASCKAVNK